MANVVGIDAHKGTLTCSAVDELGRGSARSRPPTTAGASPRSSRSRSGSAPLELASNVLLLWLDSRSAPRGGGLRPQGGPRAARQAAPEVTRQGQERPTRRAPDRTGWWRVKRAFRRLLSRGWLMT
jgi:hypothetical protein